MGMLKLEHCELHSAAKRL